METELQLQRGVDGGPSAAQHEGASVGHTSVNGAIPKTSRTWSAVERTSETTQEKNTRPASPCERRCARAHAPRASGHAETTDIRAKLPASRQIQIGSSSCWPWLPGRGSRHFAAAVAAGAHDGTNTSSTCSHSTSAPAASGAPKTAHDSSASRNHRVDVAWSPHSAARPPTASNARNVAQIPARRRMREKRCNSRRRTVCGLEAGLGRLREGAG